MVKVVKVYKSGKSVKVVKQVMLGPLFEVRLSTAAAVARSTFASEISITHQVRTTFGGSDVVS